MVASVLAHPPGVAHPDEHSGEDAAGTIVRPPRFVEEDDTRRRAAETEDEAGEQSDVEPAGAVVEATQSDSASLTLASMGDDQLVAEIGDH
jgi:hypothetical protein